MWLENLEVHNFRSIENISINFSEGINVLIGENGTGKSNIANSILKILGPTFPSENSFPTDDYYRFDTTLPIIIKCRFSDGETISWSPIIKGGSSHRGPKLTKSGFQLNDEDRIRYCPLHIPPSREIRELPGSSKWTPAGRIIFELSKLIASDSTLYDEYCEKMEDCISVLSNSDQFSKFCRLTEEFSKEHLGGRGDNIGIRLGFLDHRNILKTIQVFEQICDQPFNVSGSGQGIQSSVNIAMLRAYSEICGGSLFIIADEPEAYLHPQAQKALCAVFEKIAENGTQIILTTHSPHFISNFHLSGIHKISMNDEKTIANTIDFSTLTARKIARGITCTEDSVKGRITRMVTTDVKEGCFAKKVVLCEGETEGLSLEVWTKCLNVDLSRGGVSIVQCGSKNSIIDFAEFYLNLGIPSYIIFDSDHGCKPEAQKSHEDLNTQLLNFCGDGSSGAFPVTTISRNYCVFSPDYEKVVTTSDGNYQTYSDEVVRELGSTRSGGKGLKARQIALKYFENGTPIPKEIENLVRAIEAF